MYLLQLKYRINVLLLYIVIIINCMYLLFVDIQQIRSDVQSRLWFTYRKGFLQIGNTNFTSDRGWGCMLRCGQMVIGQALIFLHLGKFS